MQENNTKLTQCLQIIKDSYPKMQKLSIEDYERISREIELGKVDASNELLTQLLPVMKYTAQVFSHTKLNISLFNDFLDEVVLGLTEIVNRKAKDNWFSNYNSYTSSYHKLIDRKIKLFIEDSASKKHIGHGKKKKSIDIESYEALSETLPDDSREIFENLAKEILRDLVFDVIDTLTLREKEYISLWMGLEGEPMNFREIGNHYNVSGEYVRQVIAKGMRKLRHPSRSKRLRDFYEL